MALFRMCNRGPWRPSSLVARLSSTQHLFGKNGPNIELRLNENSEFSSGRRLTVSLVGPSRKGKSVTAGLLVKNHKAFPYSHNPSNPKTSGTQICATEVNGTQYWVVDSEGLSHTEGHEGALVAKKLLSATYLTSSWIVWLDSNVMEDSFFESMQLVKEYIGNTVPREQMPKLLYVRTCENDMARKGYAPSKNFQQYFANEMSQNKQLAVLQPMFREMKGLALPEFTTSDLDAHEGNSFWGDEYHSPYKQALKLVIELLVAESFEPPLSVAGVKPLLPVINELDAVDFHTHAKQQLEKRVAESFKQFQVDASNKVLLHEAVRQFKFVAESIGVAFAVCKNQVLKDCSALEANFLEKGQVYIAMQFNKDAMLMHCQDSLTEIANEAEAKFGGSPQDVVSVVDSCWARGVQELPSAEFVSWLSRTCSTRGMGEADVKLSSLVQPYVLKLKKGCEADTIYKHIGMIELKSESSILLEAIRADRLNPDFVEKKLSQHISQMEEQFMKSTKNCLDLSSMRRLRIYQSMASKKNYFVSRFQFKEPLKIWLQHAPTVAGKLSTSLGLGGSGASLYAGAAGVACRASLAAEAGPIGLAATVGAGVGYACAASTSEYIAWDLGCWDSKTKALWVSSQGSSWYLYESEKKDEAWYGTYVQHGEVASTSKLDVPKMKDD